METNVDKMCVTSVCIDDFALKKRQRYGTVMVDVETRKIVDMIESRETDDVCDWLKNYPNIRVVSRDGSQQYAAAITKALPNAMQVSDRFHIVKNLSERAKDVYKRLFQGRIAIPITSGTQDFRYEMLVASASERASAVAKLRCEGRSKSEIILMTGLTERAVNKLLNMKEIGTMLGGTTVRGREHEQAVNKLLDRANRVRALKDAGLSITKISQETGYGWTTVKNYLSDNFSPINAHYGKQREGKLAPYRDEVLRLRADGHTYKAIHNIIKIKGYTGTQDAIRGFVTKEQRIRRDIVSAVHDGNPVEYIDKKWMMKLLYKPNEKSRGLTDEQLSAIFDNYPLARTVLDLVKEFKALLKKKKPELLVQWMEKAISTGIPEFDTFVNGLKQDIDAVCNIFMSDVNNGLAEGTINKIKVIKRVMYGRCRFDLLRNKCLALDYPR